METKCNFLLVEKIKKGEKMLTANEIEEKASETRSWLESACMDCAFDDKGNLDESMADEMFENVDVLHDMIGDHIYDHAKGDPKTMILISKALKKIAHPPLKKACDALIKYHSGS